VYGLSWRQVAPRQPDRVGAQAGAVARLVAGGSEMSKSKPCDYDGCKDTNTTPCFYVIYRFDLPLLKALFEFGPKQAWRLWRDEYIEVLDGHYCAEHAYKEGFCWACGNFYAGASERFDFQINGQRLCDGCWSNFYEPENEWEEDYYPGPWDD